MAYLMEPARMCACGCLVAVPSRRTVRDPRQRLAPVTTVAWHGYCVANCRNRRARRIGCQRLVCAPEHAFSRTLGRGR
jgi:hypothetical protein